MKRAGLTDRVVITGSSFLNFPKDLDNIDAWSYENWMKVPYLQRQACVAHLKTLAEPHILELWKRQHHAGKSIGSDNVRFHFSTGMSVRNALRDIIPDERLPSIKQKHISRRWWGFGPYQVAKNWDDFYMGALQDLVEQELARDGKPA